MAEFAVLSDYLCLGFSGVLRNLWFSIVLPAQFWCLTILVFSGFVNLVVLGSNRGIWVWCKTGFWWDLAFLADSPCLGWVFLVFARVVVLMLFFVCSGLEFGGFDDFENLWFGLVW